MAQWSEVKEPGLLPTSSPSCICTQVSSGSVYYEWMFRRDCCRLPLLMRQKDVVLSHKRRSSSRTIGVTHRAEWEQSGRIPGFSWQTCHTTWMILARTVIIARLVPAEWNTALPKGTLAEEDGFWQRCFHYYCACCSSFSQTGCKVSLYAGKVDPKTSLRVERLNFGGTSRGSGYMEPSAAASCNVPWSRGYDIRQHQGPIIDISAREREPCLPHTSLNTTPC